MNRDFIKVTKSQVGNVYFVEIYFSEINSTIRISFKEIDFIHFITESIDLFNEKSEYFKIDLPEPLNEVIKNFREKDLKNIRKKFIEINQSKPEVDVTIFVSDSFVPLHYAEQITNSSGDFMEALGFELETEDEPIFGSFFKRLKYVFSRTIGDEDLVNIYEKGKKALELKHIELPTAEQTEKLATSAEKLVNALSNVEEGVIRCGALIVLKKNVHRKPKLIIQQLSTEMILILDKKPKLLFNVNTIYELLTGDVENDFGEPDGDKVLIA